MGLPRFTNLQDYYANPALFGDYQYISLKDLVNDYMYSLENDSYTFDVNVNRVVFHAKKGIQELYFDVINDIIAVELELTPSLIIPLPHDYISYCRISWVDLNGKLHPLAVDNSLNLSQAYLQDNNYNILFDLQGDVLTGSHIQNKVGSQQQPYGYNAVTDYSLDGPNSYVSPYYQQGLPFNTNRSKIFKNGSYTIDREQGVIQFSSNVTGRIIVLEYISNGMYQRSDEQIKIHKFAEEATNSYIYWKLIEKRRSVPENAKRAARAEWFNNRRLAKRRIQPVRQEEIRQVLNGSGRMIKD